MKINLGTLTSSGHNIGAIINTDAMKNKRSNRDTKIPTDDNGCRRGLGLMGNDVTGDSNGNGAQLVLRVLG